MLSPKRTKYRKCHRGRMKGFALRGNKIGALRSSFFNFLKSFFIFDKAINLDRS
jgi:ribosomal protein L16/L10AE